MNTFKTFSTLVLLASFLISCSPSAVENVTTPTEPESTQTPMTPTKPSLFTAFPTETQAPTSTFTPSPPSCAVPTNPIDSATAPAQGPFDFTWTVFPGAASYIVSIGPVDWYPTNFPVVGTTLTRYMESFPSSPTYQWSITAVDSSGQEICKTDPYYFVISTDQFATPSFVDSLIFVPTITNNTTTSQSILQESNTSLYMADPNFKVSLLSIEDSKCHVTVTLSVNVIYPIDSSRLRYTTDPNEAYSGNFCRFGNGMDLWPTNSTTYRAEVNLSRYPFRNGDTAYFVAEFLYNGGMIGCSQIFEHPVTTVCADN